MKLVIDNDNLLQRIDSYRDAAYKRTYRRPSRTAVVIETLAANLPAAAQEVIKPSIAATQEAPKVDPLTAAFDEVERYRGLVARATGSYKDSLQQKLDKAETELARLRA